MRGSRRAISWTERLGAGAFLRSRPEMFVLMPLLSAWNVAPGATVVTVMPSSVCAAAAPTVRFSVVSSASLRYTSRWSALSPWLPAAFCAAAALPQIRPARRKMLLQSLSEAAATAPGWSDREPCFYPERVEAEAA